MDSVCGEVHMCVHPMFLPSLMPRQFNELTQTVYFCMPHCNHNQVDPGTVKTITSNILEKTAFIDNKAQHFDTDITCLVVSAEMVSFSIVLSVNIAAFSIFL